MKIGLPALLNSIVITWATQVFYLAEEFKNKVPVHIHLNITMMKNTALR